MRSPRAEARFKYEPDLPTWVPGKWSGGRRVAGSTRAAEGESPRRADHRGPARAGTRRRRLAFSGPRAPSAHRRGLMETSCPLSLTPAGTGPLEREVRELILLCLLLLAACSVDFQRPGSTEQAAADSFAGMSPGFGYTSRTARRAPADYGKRGVWCPAGTRPLPTAGGAVAFVPAADHVAHEPGSVAPFLIGIGASAGLMLTPRALQGGQRQLSVSPPETFKGRPGS